MMAALSPANKVGEESSSPYVRSSRSESRRKVSVIREEFVALTGDPLVAAVMNQLLYWSQRVSDYDLFLEEERSASSQEHGWFYKSAHELIDETLLCISEKTLRRQLAFLIRKEWLMMQKKGKWNRTAQYRVNLRNLQKDLHALGYDLPGFSFSTLSEEGVTLFKGQNVSFEEDKLSSWQEPGDLSCGQVDPSEGQNVLFEEDKSSLSKETTLPSRRGQNVHFNTEIKEITKREHTARAKISKNVFEDILGLWAQHVGQKVVLTKKRQQILESLLDRHFESDVAQWAAFCERIKASPFLMGEGKGKWRVSLDWILIEANFLKVLEGNYDDPEALKAKEETSTIALKEQEKAQILASIEDEQWKGWCTQLSRSDGFEEPISLYELKALSQATFVEFDGRLVWIEAEDTEVLRHLEKNHFKLLSLVKKTYPLARNLRTQLSPFKQAKGDLHHD